MNFNGGTSDTPKHPRIEYLVKERHCLSLLSHYLFSYEDARLAAIKLGGIVTNLNWFQRHCPEFDRHAITDYPRE